MNVTEGLQLIKEHDNQHQEGIIKLSSPIVFEGYDSKYTYDYLMVRYYDVDEADDEEGLYANHFGLLAVKTPEDVEGDVEYLTVNVPFMQPVDKDKALIVFDINNLGEDNVFNLLKQLNNDKLIDDKMTWIPSGFVAYPGVLFDLKEAFDRIEWI